MGAEMLSTPTSTGTATPSIPAARFGASATPAPAPAGTQLAAESPERGRLWTVPEKAARPPRISRPEPRLRQLMGVCGWAAVLGGIGLVLGIRGLIGVLSNEAPGWYEPSIVAAGLAGIGLTVGAFLTVHRRREPWVLLGMSSVSLIAGMVLTSAAF